MKRLNTHSPHMFTLHWLCSVEPTRGSVTCKDLENMEKNLSFTFKFVQHKRISATLLHCQHLIGFSSWSQILLEMWSEAEEPNKDRRNLGTVLSGK